MLLCIHVGKLLKLIYLNVAFYLFDRCALDISTKLVKIMSYPTSTSEIITILSIISTVVKFYLRIKIKQKMTGAAIDPFTFGIKRESIILSKTQQIILHAFIG